MRAMLRCVEVPQGWHARRTRIRICFSFHKASKRTLYAKHYSLPIIRSANGTTVAEGVTDSAITTKIQAKTAGQTRAEVQARRSKTHMRSTLVRKHDFSRRGLFSTSHIQPYIRKTLPCFQIRHFIVACLAKPTCCISKSRPPISQERNIAPSG